MTHHSIIVLDLHFMNIPGTIAAFLLPHKHGAVLIESGPGSTQEALTAGLALHGFTPADVTDVLLTHIHLDHAGAAGWLAGHGARIHVHPLGSTHMLNPEKLLTSAARIYGDMMQTLWGDFLPVPENRLSVVTPGDVIEIEDLRILAVDTPGHAEHHFVYVFDKTCFSGDVGGVRINSLNHLRLPMPPPEFNLEKWRMSLQRLYELNIDRIAPTHFGIFNDTAWHLKAIDRALVEIEAWMTSHLHQDPPVDQINREFLDWAEKRSLAEGVTPDQIRAYEAANPSWMSGYGMQRYWRKNRLAV